MIYNPDVIHVYNDFEWDGYRFEFVFGSLDKKTRVFVSNEFIHNAESDKELILQHVVAAGVVHLGLDEEEAKYYRDKFYGILCNATADDDEMTLHSDKLVSNTVFFKPMTVNAEAMLEMSLELDNLKGDTGKPVETSITATPTPSKYISIISVKTDEGWKQVGYLTVDGEGVKFSKHGPIAPVKKFTVKFTIDATNTKQHISELAERLPGVMTEVAPPCNCEGWVNAGKFSVYNIIIHLNDRCNPKWTREQIADWVDKLHDDGIINAEF